MNSNSHITIYQARDNYFKQGQLPQAINLCQKILAQNPQDFTSLEMSCQINQKFTDKILSQNLQSLQKLVQVNISQNYPYLVLASQVYLQYNNSTLAIKCCHHCLQINYQYHPAYFQLANIYQFINDFSSAQHNYLLAIKHATHQKSYSLNKYQEALGKFYFLNNKITLAKKYLTLSKSTYISKLLTWEKMISNINSFPVSKLTSTQKDSSDSKIGLIILATGHYFKNAIKLFTSADTYFLPSQQVTYFLLTDNNNIPFSLIDRNLEVIAVKKAGSWPWDSLLRFQLISHYKHKFKNMDYLFWSDADQIMINQINTDILQPLVGTIMPFYPADYRSEKCLPFPWEKNPISSINYQSDNPNTIYFSAGFWGGESKYFWNLIETCASLIRQDLKNDIIATMDDMSYLNFYFHQCQAPTQVLGPEYCYLEPPSDEEQIAHIQCIFTQAKIMWTEKISEIPYESGVSLLSDNKFHIWNINKVVNTQLEKGIQNIPTLIHSDYIDLSSHDLPIATLSNYNKVHKRKNKSSPIIFPSLQHHYFPLSNIPSIISSTIFLVYASNLSRVEMILNTWAKHIPHILFFSDSILHPIINIQLPECKNQDAFKTHQALQFLNKTHSKLLSHCQYLVKCDDDTFIHLPHLINKLNKINIDSTDKPYYSGFSLTLPKPQEQFPYASGGAGYIINLPAFHILIQRLNKYLNYHWAEDVCIGKCLYYHVKLDHEPQMFPEYSLLLEWQKDTSLIPPQISELTTPNSNKIISFHHVSPSEMKELYQQYYLLETEIIHFYHIPKNAGTSFREAIQKLPNFKYIYHNQTLNSLSSTNSLIILRDPLERFCSAVRYALQKWSQEPHIKKIIQAELKSPWQWAQILTDKNHPHYPLLMAEIENYNEQTIGNKKIKYSWTYQSQNTWLANKQPKYVLLQDNLYWEIKVANQFYNWNIQLSQYNSTLSNSHDVQDITKLSPIGYKFLLKFYQDDIKLYQKYKNMSLEKRLGILHTKN